MSIAKMSAINLIKKSSDGMPILKFNLLKTIPKIKLGSRETLRSRMPFINEKISITLRGVKGLIKDFHLQNSMETVMSFLTPKIQLYL